jgi:hypothetical protein
MGSEEKLAVAASKFKKDAEERFPTAGVLRIQFLNPPWSTAVYCYD